MPYQLIINNFYDLLYHCILSEQKAITLLEFGSEQNDILINSNWKWNIIFSELGATLLPAVSPKPARSTPVNSYLSHWGQVRHTCISKLTIIVSDNGLSPGQDQAIIWNNAEKLLIEPSGTNFSEILFKILTFSFPKMQLKMSSGKWRPFCLGLNVLYNEDHPHPRCPPSAQKPHFAWVLMMNTVIMFWCAISQHWSKWINGYVRRSMYTTQDWTAAYKAYIYHP